MGAEAHSPAPAISGPCLVPGAWCPAPEPCAQCPEPRVPHGEGLSELGEGWPLSLEVLSWRVLLLPPLLGRVGCLVGAVVGDPPSLPLWGLVPQ